MKIKKIKKHMLLFVLVSIIGIIFLGFTACVADIDGQYDGYSNGFNYQYGRYSSVNCAVRSESSEFIIDDVTLDFYFGWYEDIPVYRNDFGVYPVDELGDREFFSMGLYILKPEKQNPMHNEGEKDYQNIDEFYFVTEVPIQEFCSDEFAINMTPKSGKTFEKSIQVTVPKEIFNENYGSVTFVLLLLDQSQEYGTYGYRVSALMQIDYQLVDNTVVRLDEGAYHR